MKIKLLLITVLIGSSILSLGQLPYNQQENFLKANRVWVFGNNAGVDFNATSPTGIETELAATEGSASVSDPVTGQLLFYSDGEKCWNKNNQVMPNGDSLFGNVGIATQGVCIVPMVDSPGKYYLFSLMSSSLLNFVSNAPPGILFYSIIDMSLDGGLGDIMNGRKNVLLRGDTLTDSTFSSGELLSESMIAIPGDNCDIWLLLHDYQQQTPAFISYHITSEGLDTVPVISTVGGQQMQGPSAYQNGQMAVSPDRSRIAIASLLLTNTGSQTGALIAKFDAATGMVSDPLLLTNNNSYGVCFSPDNSKVYVNAWFPSSPGVFRRHTCQYDISVYDSAAIAASAMLVDSNIDRATFSYLKLYEGKIYSMYRPNGFNGLISGSLGLSCIHAPNQPGAACDYDSSNVIPFLPGTKADAAMSNDIVYPLPPDTMYQKVLDTAFCGGVSMDLQGAAGFTNYFWDDGSTSQSREVSQSGTYWVLNKDRCHSQVDTFVVEVYDFATPVITVDGFILSTVAHYDTYQWLLNGVAIAGATQAGYTVLENGNYQVVVSTADGCTDTSAIYEVNNVDIVRPRELAHQISIYPNPATDLIYVQAPIVANLALSSVEGKTLKYLTATNQLSLSDITAGVYLLKVYDLEGRLLKIEKIIKSQ